MLFGVVDDFFDLVWVLKHIGPWALAVGFFVWRDWRREERLTTRIETLEQQQDGVIIPLVKSCTEVLAVNTEVIRANRRVVKRLEPILNRAMCRHPEGPKC